MYYKAIGVTSTNDALQEMKQTIAYKTQVKPAKQYSHILHHFPSFFKHRFHSCTV